MDQKHLLSWARQWREAEGELRKVRARELRELSDEQARQASLALLELGSKVPVSRRRLMHSGLVEQQRIFQRAAR